MACPPCRRGLLDVHYTCRRIRQDGAVSHFTVAAATHAVGSIPINHRPKVMTTPLRRLVNVHFEPRHRVDRQHWVVRRTFINLSSVDTMTPHPTAKEKGKEKEKEDEHTSA